MRQKEFYCLVLVLGAITTFENEALCCSRTPIFISPIFGLLFRTHNYSFLLKPVFIRERRNFRTLRLTAGRANGKAQKIWLLVVKVV